MNWFEVKVKYMKIGNDGKEKKVSESYLFDAVSFSEAEKRTFEEMESMIQGEFVIDAIKISKVNELFPYDSGEWWFKAGVEMVTLDEDSGSEKKASFEYLVMADDIQEALNRLNENLSSCVVDYVIASVSVSNIVDVFHFIKSEEDEIEK